MTSPQLKRTPFYEFHLRQGGRMVDFAGWEMPLLYKDSGIIAEHEHTRTAASIFDVSHMGRLRFQGRDALAFLSRICTRNIAKGTQGQSMYSLVCRDDGGILDDVIVSRIDDGELLMVCNASNREKLLAWFATQRQASPGLKFSLTDETFDTSMVAIQGPKVMAMLDELLPEPPSQLKRYHFEVQRYMMVVTFTVFRSGYTGEDGVEIILGNTAAGMAMNYLMGEHDSTSLLKPAGLGARDTLRLEAAMPLYGHELTEQVDPLSAGLAWAVDLHKDFIGAPALRKIADNGGGGGPKQHIVGLFIEGPKAARQGMTVLAGGKPIGLITSGCTSPTLKRCIAMAFVSTEHAAPGTQLSVDLRGTQIPATVTPLPFYKRPK